MLNASTGLELHPPQGEGRGDDVWLFGLLLFSSVTPCAESRCAERAFAFGPHVDAKSIPQVLGAGVCGAWLFGAIF